MQRLRGELQAESLRLPEEHRLSESQIDRFMSNAKRSRQTNTDVGLAEFRALCNLLDMTAKQVRFHMWAPHAMYCCQGLTGHHSLSRR